MSSNLSQDLIPGSFALWPKSNNSYGVDEEPTTNIQACPEILQLQVVYKQTYFLTRLDLFYNPFLSGATSEH